GYSGGLSLLRLTRQTKTSHYRVSLQRCWRSSPEGYSLRYRLQLLLRPLKVLLHSCPARRRLLLEISVTSVGVEKRKLLLNHANQTVERFHQRVTLFFANLAVRLTAAFLLEQFGGGLNLRPLLINQVVQRKCSQAADTHKRCCREQCQPLCLATACFAFAHQQRMRSARASDELRLPAYDGCNAQ